MPGIAQSGLQNAIKRACRPVYARVSGEILIRSPLCGAICSRAAYNHRPAGAGRLRRTAAPAARTGAGRLARDGHEDPRQGAQATSRGAAVSASASITMARPSTRQARRSTAAVTASSAWRARPRWAAASAIRAAVSPADPSDARASRYPHPAEARIAVHRVFDPFLATAGQMRPAAPRARSPSADAPGSPRHPPDRARRHASPPARRARCPRQAQQERLRLVVARVSDIESVDAVCPHHAAIRR